MYTITSSNVTVMVKEMDEAIEFGHGSHRFPRINFCEHPCNLWQQKSPGRGFHFLRRKRASVSTLPVFLDVFLLFGFNAGFVSRSLNSRKRNCCQADHQHEYN